MHGREGHWLSMGDGANSGNYFNQSTGNPILARPFFDTVSGTEMAQLTAYTGFVDGSIQVLTNSEMHSGAISLRRHWLNGECGHIDLIAGYRFFRFRENLNIEENLVSQNVGTGFPVGSTIDLFDRFTTENDFHGAEIGVAAQWDLNQRWTVDALLKLAVGNVRQQLTINGQSTIDTGGGPVTGAGGLLALPTNIGTYTRDDFGLLPEVNLNLQYRVTRSLRVHGGYSLIFLTDIIRTGDQIDRVINSTQLPSGGGLVGPPRPGAVINDTTFWAMGLNLGAVLEF